MASWNVRAGWAGTRSQTAAICSSSDFLLPRCLLGERPGEIGVPFGVTDPGLQGDGQPFEKMDFPQRVVVIDRGFAEFLFHLGEDPQEALLNGLFMVHRMVAPVDVQRCLGPVHPGAVLAGLSDLRFSHVIQKCKKTVLQTAVLEIRDDLCNVILGVIFCEDLCQILRDHFLVDGILRVPFEVHRLCRKGAYQELVRIDEERNPVQDLLEGPGPAHRGRQSLRFPVALQEQEGACERQFCLVSVLQRLLPQSLSPGLPGISRKRRYLRGWHSSLLPRSGSHVDDDSEGVGDLVFKHLEGLCRFFKGKAVRDHRQDLQLLLLQEFHRLSEHAARPF